MNATPHDRMYDCLPLYHSVGGVVATGALLVRGGSVLIRDRFSVRALLGRRLRRQLHDLSIYRRAVPLSGQRARACPTNAPIACGFAAATGLQADIWKKFQDRFVIPHILEFYASTEGNVSLYNVEGRIGSVGRVPPFLASRFPLGAGAIRPGDRTAGTRRASEPASAAA